MARSISSPPMLATIPSPCCRNNLPRPHRIPGYASATLYAGAGQSAAPAISLSLSSAAPGAGYAAASNAAWLTAVSGFERHRRRNHAALVRRPGSHLRLVCIKEQSGIQALNFFGAATTLSLSVAAPSGTLQAAPASPFIAGENPQAVAVEISTGDGRPDIVTANDAGNSVTVLHGDGSGVDRPPPQPRSRRDRVRNPWPPAISMETASWILSRPIPATTP